MSKQSIPALWFLLLIVILPQCQQNNKYAINTIKIHPNDPFKNTISPSKFFRVDPIQDTVIEGDQGTVLVLPKGCFTDASGEVGQAPVKVELAEALTLDRMLLSNLTTTSHGQPLETDGMIYVNATANGKQLKINPNNPIRVEIPTQKRKPGMMAYRGVRDKNGNMNWIEPRTLDNFLIPVDIQSLDFLPPGFAREVEKGMPFRNYTIATLALTDSLYYNLPEADGYGDSILSGFKSTNYNEPYYNLNQKTVNGKYTDDSYTVTEKGITGKRKSGSLTSKCGINPAIIKVIKSPKYQNTLLATREFEARLKVIFGTCKNEVLEVYIKNLDKNLYELDSLAARLVSDSTQRAAFGQFATQRLTKIKDGDRYAQLLRGYYEKQLTQVTKEWEQGQADFQNEQKKKSREFEKVVASYRKVLWKREKHRMETYGFTWTKTGWINIDRGTLPKPYDSYPLQITLGNGEGLDRAYTYVIYPSIKSLYRLNSDGNTSFYAGNAEEKEMLMPRNETAVAIAIGYKGDQLLLASREFNTGIDSTFRLMLAASTTEKLRDLLRNYDNYSRANHIDTDLAFMQKMYKEEKRQALLEKERGFMENLRFVAYPCCNPDGQLLFENNCAACHATNNTVVVGPGLAKATSRHSMSWIIRFVHNSSALIAAGDPKANAIFDQYNKIQMPSYPDLAENDIRAIFKYIERMNKNR